MRFARFLFAGFIASVAIAADEKRASSARDKYLAEAERMELIRRNDQVIYITDSRGRRSILALGERGRLISNTRRKTRDGH
jgi:hypothetical protein